MICTHVLTAKYISLDLKDKLRNFKFHAILQCSGIHTLNLLAKGTINLQADSRKYQFLRHRTWPLVTMRLVRDSES